MKKIYDKSCIRKALLDCVHRDLLESLGVPLFLMEYEAGELLFAPWLDNSIFQIVLFGELSIYFTRNDGSMYSLAGGEGNYIIGEMELFSMKNSNIYAEVTKKLTSIAFTTKDHREKLFQNSRFMYFIGESMARKMAALTALDVAPASLRERVLSYMKFQCEDQRMKGIEKTAFRLHCSTRQLQRILNDYEKDGLVVKTGKGAYRLTDRSGTGFTLPHSDKYLPADEIHPQ